MGISNILPLALAGVKGSPSGRKEGAGIRVLAMLHCPPGRQAVCEYVHVEQSTEQPASEFCAFLV